MRLFSTFSIILISLLFTTLHLYAFIDNDSLAYEHQREKINNMLDQRSGKFGQYTESLNSRTGIFGFKTKKDMQKSIDILLDIAQTDNTIIKETKVLLDYKIFQQQKVVTQFKETDERNISYMRTINKLQNRNDELLQENDSLKQTKQGNIFYISLFSMIIGGILYHLFRKFYSKKK